MFTLRPESIKTFVEDKKIKLPRFQRKATWDEKKNFNLCISVFRDYPLGVVVIKVESGSGKASELQKWLLDGRQRREALGKIKNPENIYDWAKSAIKFKNNDNEDELREKYWAYVRKYIGEDEEDAKNNGDIKNNLEPEQNDVEIEDQQLLTDYNESTPIENNKKEDATTQLTSQDSTHSKDQGLKDLLELITIVHKKKKGFSGLTRAFDFSKNIDKIDYVKNKDEGVAVDSDELLIWLDSKKRYAEIRGEQYPPTEESFYKWLTEGRAPIISEASLRKQINDNWTKIQKVFDCLAILDTRLQEAKIGYLELTDVDDIDAKKIFEIINTGGVQLTAAEILSAKPSWNKQIDNPHPAVKTLVRNLYLKMNITPIPSNIVKWDIAATLLDRIQQNFILSDLSDNNEKKVTLGFKIMSGYYRRSISKEDISKLADLNNNVDWTGDTLARNLNDLIKQLSSIPVFRFYDSWKKSLMDITSDAVAINYILIMLKDWENKGKPAVANSAQYKSFQKHAIILFDKMIYEYLSKVWRGSSDSRIENNLKTLDQGLEEIFIPISNEKWSSLIEDITEKGIIFDYDYAKNEDKSSVERILYYYYVIKSIPGPNDPLMTGIDIDHIIPQNAFASVHDPKIKCLKDNIVNLALLPKRENVNKSNRKLTDITDDWLKSQIKAYEEIEENQYEQFSCFDGILELQQYRGNLIKEAFRTNRKKLIDEIL